MESFTNDYTNEHDYTTRLEVPLEAIKTEILNEEYDRLESQSDQDVARVPIVLRDNKPKLRKKKESLLLPKPHQKQLLPQKELPPRLQLPTQVLSPPQKQVPPQKQLPKQSLLLPRPIMPRMQLPPPIPPALKSDPPPNCKGVLVVQDVKFCTMYVPKNGNGTGPTIGAALPIHSFPMGALANATVAPPVIAKSVAPPSPLIHQSNVSEKVPDTPAPKSILQANNIECPKGLEEASPPNAPRSNQVNKVPVKSTYPLIGEVQKQLCGMLPLYWFSSAENNGVNIMLLSYGKEKAIQRRLFVTIGGNVEISVHCQLLPEYFVQGIIKKAGHPVRLTATSVKIFSDWIVKMVQILRDFQVCVGLERSDYREMIIQHGDIVVDKNPYQECRYTETVRSKHCLRLVDAGKRRCAECCKTYSVAKRQVTSPTSPTIRKRKPNVSPGPKSKQAGPIGIEYDGKFQQCTPDSSDDDCDTVDSRDQPDMQSDLLDLYKAGSQAKEAEESETRITKKLKTVLKSRKEMK